MRKVLAVVGIVLLAGAVAATAQQAEKQRELAENGNPAFGRGTGPVSSRVAPRIAPGGGGMTRTSTTGFSGTVQYDSGTLDALPTQFGVIYGNRFSETASGASFVSSSIDLNSFSFFFMEDSIGDTGLIFQPGLGTGGGASLIARASINVAGLANSGQSFSSPTINTVNQTALGTTGNFAGNSFFLGAWCLNANTAFPVDNETIGLATGGTHGYTASSGATGTFPAAAQSWDAILRANVTTDIKAIPVELVAFGVDSE